MEEYVEGAHGMPLKRKSACDHVTIHDVVRVGVLGCHNVGGTMGVGGM